MDSEDAVLDLAAAVFTVTTGTANAFGWGERALRWARTRLPHTLLLLFELFQRVWLANALCASTPCQKLNRGRSAYGMKFSL